MLLAVMAFIAVANVTGLNAQCDPEECEGFEPILTSAVVQLPGFPGCDVEIDYTYRLCPPPFGLTNIDVQGFSVIGGSPACDGLNAFLFPGGTPNWAGIEWAFREGYNALVRKLFIQAYTANPSVYQCPSTVASYASAWRSCAQILVSSRGISPWPWPWFRVRIRSCNDDICCLQKTELCYDVATGTIKETHSWTYGSYGECGDPPPSPIGTIFASDCLPWCVQ